MQICQSCNSQQLDSAVFCDECGTALGASTASGSSPAYPSPPKRTAILPSASPSAAAAPDDGGQCADCGAVLEPGSNFCDMCGASVADGPESALASMPSHPDRSSQPPASPQMGMDAWSDVPSYDQVSISAHLIVQRSNATLPLPVGKTEIILGREDSMNGCFPDIDLTDYGADESGISRQHARIALRGSQITIEDLNSTNYTFVNQQKLAPGQPHPLNHGDEIRLGRMKLGFYVN